MKRTFTATAVTQAWQDSPSDDKGNLPRSGFTCVELIAAELVLCSTVAATLIAGIRFGEAAGFAAGMIAGLAACLVVRSFYRWSSRRFEKEMLDLNQRFSGIYRVLHVPPDLRGVLAQGAIVQCGDYGWEAEPIYNDGLIYLHGLTEEWTVAWYVGFRPEQVELVGEKPRSQYYLPYSWVGVGAQPPPCRFPVQHASEGSLGFPERIDFPFVQGVKVDRVKQ